MFQLDLTNNAQASGAPDEFTFQLIDKSDAEIPTTDSSGSNSRVVIDLTGSAPQPEIYSATGDGVNITPTVQTVVTAVPEPSTAWLVVCAGAVCVLGVRKRLARR
jgi:hypothetical protein